MNIASDLKTESFSNQDEEEEWKPVSPDAALTGMYKPSWAS